MVDVENILDRGVSSGASDIHLIHKCKPILRVKKELIYLNEYEVLGNEEMQFLFNYFVGDSIEKRENFNKNKLLDVNFEHAGTRFRVNVSLSSDVPIFTLRIVRDILPKFEQLGLPDIVKRMTLQTQGLILVTGKPNSGKTTTLNALVDCINEAESKKILILENPIEFIHKNKNSLIVQKEVGVGRDCNDFSDGTKNALREDCDVLVIGEIRDRETMDAAIEMAESGHLVIGTLHTNSCAETVDRILNFYDINEQFSIKSMISAILKLVVSQRLLKRTNGALIMIPEVMAVDSTISGIIRRDKLSKSEIEDAIQMGLDRGNISFNISLANAVVNQFISLESALKEVDEKSHELFLRTVNQIKTKKL